MIKFFFLSWTQQWERNLPSSMWLVLTLMFLNGGLDLEKLDMAPEYEFQKNDKAIFGSEGAVALLLLELEPTDVRRVNALQDSCGSKWFNVIRTNF